MHGRGGHRQGPPPPPPPPPPERRRRRRWRAAAAAAAAATAAARRQRLCAGAGYGRPTPAAARSETPSSPRSVAIRGAKNRHIQIQMGGGRRSRHHRLRFGRGLDSQGRRTEPGAERHGPGAYAPLPTGRIELPAMAPAGMPWRNPLPGPETDPPNERGRGELDLRQSYELAVVSEWGVTLRWLYHPPSQLPGKGDTFAAGDVQVSGRAVSELNLDRLAPGWAVRGSDVMSEP